MGINLYGKFKNISLKASFFIFVMLGNLSLDSKSLVSFTFLQKTMAHDVSPLLPQTINKYGIVGQNSSWSETRPYYCSRFVRQVFQRAFPQLARSLDDNYFGASAYETESMWARQGKLRSYSKVAKSGGLKVGDVLFQDYPVYGHIGILVLIKGKFYVSENTVRYGLRVKDHRALTPLARFGKIRSVGRYTGFGY